MLFFGDKQPPMDSRIWRRIIMGAAVALTGVIGITAVAFQHVMRTELETARHTPIVGVIENGDLPRGIYNIYQVYLDENLTYHFLVSNANGGAVVAAKPQDQSVIPHDILEAEKYDAACYRILVTQAKNWKFCQTRVHEDFLAKLRIKNIPRP